MATKKKTKKVTRCDDCGRRLRGDGAEWTCRIDIDDDGLGTVAEISCPGCATDEEHFLREVNDSMTRYQWLANGKLARYPKTPLFAQEMLN